ncbi:MAG: hypothetical protein IPH88_18095 [Bacteroidales bacterium]|nr:hypothetical protein [Bacteroidales bacterium]
MNLFSQVAINSDGSQAEGSAMLDIRSSNKGFLLPRMTLDEASNISNPVAGLQVYCTDCGVNGEGALLIFMAGAWYKVNLNCLIPSAPSVGQHLFTTDQITWIWEPVINASGYKWNSTNDFSTAIDLANDTATTESCLTCETQYTRYLWTYSQCGISKPRLLTQVTASSYVQAPVQNSSTANKDQIIWRWHAVPGSSGYKWNTVDDYYSASELGVDTTFIETGPYM